MLLPFSNLCLQTRPSVRLAWPLRFIPASLPDQEVSPTEFEELGGNTAKKWRNSITVGSDMLGKWLNRFNITYTRTPVVTVQGKRVNEHGEHVNEHGDVLSVLSDPVEVAVQCGLVEGMLVVFRRVIRLTNGQVWLEKGAVRAEDCLPAPGGIALASPLLSCP